MHQKRNGETTRQPREISRRIFEGGRYGSLFGNNFRNWKTKWETLFRYYEATPYACIYIYAFLLERTSSFDSRLEFHGFPGKCALPAPYLRPEEINQA